MSEDLRVSVSECEGQYTVTLNDVVLSVGDNQKDTVLDAYNRVRGVFYRAVDELLPNTLNP